MVGVWSVVSTLLFRFMFLDFLEPLFVIFLIFLKLDNLKFCLCIGLSWTFNSLFQHIWSWVMWDLACQFVIHAPFSCVNYNIGSCFFLWILSRSYCTGMTVLLYSRMMELWMYSLGVKWNFLCHICITLLVSYMTFYATNVLTLGVIYDFLCHIRFNSWCHI